ncbi:MAG: glycerol-3-phosphate responsive antiterminator [Tissierellia bacterium]|nr:glycerol-3-phosphate responsive antiterminator [Tissierellia bacterium]
MSNKKIIECIEENPIIVAVKNSEELEMALQEDSKIIFLLNENLLQLKQDIEAIKKAKKYSIVHIDLVEGLSAKEVTVDFIKSYTQADGIISTRPKNVKRAKELHLFSILRLFLIDSLSFNNLEKNIDISQPDMVEILPGVMPKIIKRITSQVKTPIIAGGLISDKEDVISALNAGAIAISSSNSNIWRI